jgi:RNA polymerase sigma-70 factor (ECF subfamily)
MAQRIPPDVAGEIACLFRQDSGAVFRSALRAVHGNRHEADDLVQEAFRAAALNWQSLRWLSPERKRAWLCRVAINKAIDGYRAGSRLSARAEDYPEREAPSAEHLALSRVAMEHCLKVIGDMPEVRRKVAYLRFHEEWGSREIAGHLGIAVSTVRVHVHAARAALEAAVGPELPQGRPGRQAGIGEGAL